MHISCMAVDLHVFDRGQVRLRPSTRIQFVWAAEPGSTMMRPGPGPGPEGATSKNMAAMDKKMKDMDARVKSVDCNYLKIK